MLPTLTVDRCCCGQDSEGNFHAVFHHMYGTGTKTQWWLDATGGHAFSRDGWSWT